MDAIVVGEKKVRKLDSSRKMKSFPMWPERHLSSNPFVQFCGRRNHSQFLHRKFEYHLPGSKFYVDTNVIASRYGLQKSTASTHFTFSTLERAWDHQNDRMAPNFDLKDKVIVINGGSGGIGFATTELLISQGAKVSIPDVSEKSLAEASSKLKSANHLGQFMSTLVDVRKPEQVDAWIKDTVAKFGNSMALLILPG